MTHEYYRIFVTEMPTRNVHYESYHHVNVLHSTSQLFLSRYLPNYLLEMPVDTFSLFEEKPDKKSYSEHS